MSNLAKRIKDIIFENSGTVDEKISVKSSEYLNSDMGLVDLGVDDLDRLIIVQSIEHVYDIEIDLVDADKWSDVGDVIEYVEQLL